MAGGWATQRRVDDLDDIDAWMAQRNANVALRDEAEAIGRDLWDQATRDGQDLAAPQPSDLVAIGAGALDWKRPSGLPASAGPPAADEQDTPPEQADSDVTLTPQPDPGPILVTAPRDRFATAGSRGRIPSQLGQPRGAAAATDPQTQLFAQRLNSGLNIWSGESPVMATAPPARGGPKDQPWWDRNEEARALAGRAGLVVGRGLGALRGAARIGKDAIGEAGFTARLAAPPILDKLLSPPGMSARQQMATNVGETLRYLDQVRARPGLALSDLNARAVHAATDLFPEASPPADTALGEFRRNVRIGANRGELEANVAMLPLGGEAAEGISALRLASAEARAGKLAARYPQAEGYWDEVYDGAGHHYFSRRKGNFANIGGVPAPSILRALPLPTFLRDSELFRLRPEGITNGEMFARHIQSDPQYRGGKIPDEYGGGNWRAGQAGLQALSPALRMWAGASGPLRATVATGAAGGAVASSYLDDWSRR
jgi:hypothetical protein